MEKKNGASRAIFEPDYIEAALSPFSAHEKRSTAHTDRLSGPVENNSLQQDAGAVKE